jgi:hypothetical protein
LREIIAILRQTYCGRIGIEYMHIQVLPSGNGSSRNSSISTIGRKLTNAAKKEVLRVPDRGRNLRAFPRPPLYRDQAVRHRGRGDR